MGRQERRQDGQDRQESRQAGKQAGRPAQAHGTTCLVYDVLVCLAAVGSGTRRRVGVTVEREGKSLKTAER